MMAERRRPSLTKLHGLKSNVARRLLFCFLLGSGQLAMKCSAQCHLTVVQSAPLLLHLPIGLFFSETFRFLPYRHGDSDSSPRSFDFSGGSICLAIDARALNRACTFALTLSTEADLLRLSVELAAFVAVDTVVVIVSSMLV